MGHGSDKWSCMPTRLKCKNVHLGNNRINVPLHVKNNLATDVDPHLMWKLSGYKPKIWKLPPTPGWHPGYKAVLAPSLLHSSLLPFNPAAPHVLCQTKLLPSVLAGDRSPDTYRWPVPDPLVRRVIRKLWRI